MKNALISPNISVSYLSGYTQQEPIEPIWTIIPNSERVAEVANEPFPIALPFFWVECADDVKPETHYYDMSDNQIKPVPVVSVNT